MATPYSGPYPRSEPLWPFEGGIFRGSDTHWESPRLSSSAFLAGCECAEHRTCAAEPRLASPLRPVPRTSAFPRCISWSSPAALRQFHHCFQILILVKTAYVKAELGVQKLHLPSFERIRSV